MKQTILTFYKFVCFEDYKAWQTLLEDKGESLSVLGTIILAKEGINATISGQDDQVREFLRVITDDKRFADLRPRESFSERKTFYRLKILLRDEIVTLGDQTINPNKQVGKYVEPEDWNELIRDPDITLVDTRNDYEVALGSFEGAVNPKTSTFREWDQFVAENLDKKKNKKIAMFCTGGIRCEKASAHLLQHGFDEVFHLKGGILNYLEKISPDHSKWDGECFIFDHRVSVVHGLKDGESKLCFGCRWPLSQQDLESPNYEEGVSCPKCYDSLTESKRESLRERQRQVKRADAKNLSHIGQKMPEID